MNKTIRQNLAFILPYFLFLFVAGYFIAFYPKREIHLYINQFNNRFADYFFYYATFLGDGIAVTVMVFLLCFVKYRFAILMAVSNIFSSFVVQMLKHTVFKNVDRPTKFFEGVAHLKLVPWVENYIYNSFPSGHTTAAFATFFCFSLIMKKKIMKFLMFITALTIGFSRVYLSQHFLNDIYAGSVIGVIISLLVYQYIVFSEKLNNIKWMEKNILTM